MTMAMTSRRSSLTTSFTRLSLDGLFLDCCSTCVELLRPFRSISHCEIKFHILTRRVILKHVPCQRGSSAAQAMKRPAKKVATDRSFVVALSRGLDVLRAFHPNDGLLGNQEIAARTNLPKPTVSRLTYTLTKLGYLTPVPRFEKYQLAPSAWRWVCRPCKSRRSAFVRTVREGGERDTGGAVALGGRDRHSMIYFGRSRSGQTRGVQLTRFARADRHHGNGPRLDLGVPDEERALLRDCASITAAAGRGCATASNAPAKRSSTRFRDLGRRVA